MAVHVVLSRDEVCSILSLYHLEKLEDFGGIPEGSINTSYWVQVAGRRYFLRITERKRIDDMIYERRLLAHLASAQLPVPRLLENVAKGTFTPWTVRGRFVSLFEYLDGRDLGLFEVRPTHVRQIAKFAAKMHTATHDFERERRNAFDIPSLEQKLEKLTHALSRSRLGAKLAPDVERLQHELAKQKQRALDHLPRGTVHGDLFIDNAKFKDGKLSGVIDFEMASTERFTWELAVGINAWCWQPSVEQRGGPAGHFDKAKTRAFLRGYCRERMLTKAEKAALPHDMRLAAARFAITRLVDFELKKLPPERRVYKDYRHYMQRLNVLSTDRGAEAIVKDALRDCE
ncbi:homoserine kinase [Myxococcota bacterium]|nr:homoserine kinase [Myxococcota bacterium]